MRVGLPEASPVSDSYVPVEQGTMDVLPLRADWKDRPDDVAATLREHMQAWPSLRATIAMAPTDHGTTRLMMASRPDALDGSDPDGAYGIIADLCSAPSMKDVHSPRLPCARAIGPQTHEMEIAGTQTPETLGAALADGRSPNDEAMLRHLIDGLPKGRVAILLGGPSAAGKTSLTETLRRLAGDRKIAVLSGDMYFRDKDDELYPRTAEGGFNFDSPSALHLDELGGDIAELLNTGVTQAPIYDFKAVRPGGWRRPTDGFTGCRLDKTERLELADDGILVIDSLHATNEVVSSRLNDLHFVSLYLDTPRAEDRLLRRIVRDAATRGTPAPDTLQMWDKSVFPGEIYYVRPTLLNLQPARDLYYVTKGPNDLGLSRAEIDRRVQLLTDYGLPATYENFSAPEDSLRPLST